MSVQVWAVLAGTHAAAFVAGLVLPWHYGDFASSCRTGADTARRIRRRIEEILGVIFPVARAAENVSDSSVMLYRSLITAHRVCDTVDELGVDFLDLRDDHLADELDAFFAAVRGRVRWGHMDVVPALNKPGALEDQQSEGRKMLATLTEATRDLDVPACKRLIASLGRISNWPGFARHRLTTWKRSERSL